MKKDLRVIKTKANLYEALVHLLQIKTIDKISISELCKEANINRGTFYLHYADISMLFDDYFQTVTEDLKIAYYEPYILTGNKIENLKAEMVRIFHHVDKYKLFYSVVFNKKAPLMYYYQLFDILKEYLSEQLEDEDATLMSYKSSYQADAIIGIIIEWVKRDFKESVTDLNEIIMKITKGFK